MPTIWLNTFFEGIQQDDIIGSNFGILESNNIDWNRTGYWATLWPKSNKQIKTNVPIYTNAYHDYENMVFIGNNWTKWEVYAEDSTDLTPAIEINSTHTDYFNLENCVYMSWYLYIIWRWEVWTNDSVDIQLHRYGGNSTSAQIWDITNWEFDLLSSDDVSVPIPPMYMDWEYLYIWVWGDIYKIGHDSPIDVTKFTMPTGWVTWITQHWTQFYIYQYSKYYGGRVSLWDSESNWFSANINLWFQPTKVVSKAWYDYVTTSDWETYIWSWYNFQKITEAKQTRRWDNNSQYITKTNFNYNIRVDEWNSTNIALTQIQWDIYWLATDTTPGIYKYWKLIEWLNDSIHKVITTNYDWDDFEYLYSQYYNTETKELYYSYKTANGYFVDYVDFTSLETALLWQFVTQIFRWPPEKVNKLKETRFTTSYTSWSNFIKIYRRINNWNWVLIKTINDSTNTITRHRLTKFSNEFIDEQIKVVLYNDSQSDTPPIFHWFEDTYSINKE